MTSTSQKSPRFPQADSRGISAASPPFKVHQMFNPERSVLKLSRFHNIVWRIGKEKICEATSSSNHTVSYSIGREHKIGDNFRGSNASYRVMVVCFKNLSGVQDIEFPDTSKLEVNGKEVKAKLDGMENKPAPTGAIDITEALLLHSEYINTVRFTYGKTSNEFCLAFLVYEVAIQRLADCISKGISNGETVKQHLSSKAGDPDIEATSQVLSLKCPLSRTRLVLPCRGLNCKHLACFDASSYLQLQQQDPHWQCPICQGPASWGQLRRDTYVEDILKGTPEDQDTVTIESNGYWHFNKPDIRDWGHAITRDITAERPTVDFVDLTLSDEDGETCQTPKW